MQIADEQLIDILDDNVRAIMLPYLTVQAMAAELLKLRRIVHAPLLLPEMRELYGELCEEKEWAMEHVGSFRVAMQSRIEKEGLWAKSITKSM